MSISTLTRMTVPLASNASAETQGLLMPKLQYRFRITFLGFGAVGSVTTELTKQVVDVTRPQVTFQNIVLDVYNSKVNIAGKHEWATMTVNLRDDASGNVQKLVGEQIQKQFDFFEQASAVSGQDYKFTTFIEVLDGGNGSQTPGVLETFECYGCYLEGTNYNSMNYTTSEPVTVSLTVRYDNAIQYKGGAVNGIGRNIGARTVGALTTGGGAL